MPNPLRRTSWRFWAVVVLCWPLVVAGWGFVALGMLLGFMEFKPQWDEELPFVLKAPWREWFAKRYKYSTTVSFGMGIQPGLLSDAALLKHERVHVRQGIDRCLLAFMVASIALAVDPWLALGIWGSAPAHQLPNFLGVLVRGDGHVYRDAQHERSAYAQTDEWAVPPGKSWLDDHLSRPRVW